jgi:hypothetical protein
MRRSSSIGKQRWKRITDNPTFNGIDVVEYSTTSYYSPDYVFQDYFEYPDEPVFNGDFFTDYGGLLFL